MTPPDLQMTDTIAIPSGNTPDLVYSLPAGIPESWRGEVRNWLEFLPNQFRGRLLCGLEIVTEIGRRNGEDETMIASRMLDPLRAIHDDLWRDSSAWFCIRDFIACAEKIVGDGSGK
jgi:hypothetical protein